MKARRVKNKSWVGRHKTYLLLATAIFIIAALAFIIFKGKSSENLNRINKTPNLIIITLDTTRMDHLGYDGYQGARTPNLDFLAGQGVSFDNCFSPAPLTLPSHCSIMTGTYPLHHGVRNNGSYYLSPELKTLAECFRESGYRTAAFVSSFTLDSRFGLDQGFEFYDDNFNENEVLKNFRSERTADKTCNRWMSWLDRLEGGPFFAWLHFYDPHLPYNPPSPFKEEFSRHPYDGEIAFMDSVVGKVLRHLEEENLLKDTLLVIAGDHGEALGEKLTTGFFSTSTHFGFLFCFTGRMFYLQKEFRVALD